MRRNGFGRTESAKAGNVVGTVIPGHQIVGSVTALGNCVEGFDVGDRVGVAWLNGRVISFLLNQHVSCASGRQTDYRFC